VTAKIDGKNQLAFSCMLHAYTSCHPFQDRSRVTDCCWSCVCYCCRTRLSRPRLTPRTSWRRTSTPSRALWRTRPRCAGLPCLVIPCYITHHVPEYMLAFWGCAITHLLTMRLGLVFAGYGACCSHLLRQEHRGGQGQGVLPCHVTFDVTCHLCYCVGSRVLSEALVMRVPSCSCYICHVQCAPCQYAIVCHARSSNFQLGACAGDLVGLCWQVYSGGTR
jgi:hypothetical protein